MEVEEKETVRPLANYHPCLWGDQFLFYDEQEDQASVEQLVESLQEEVRKEILVALDDPTKHTC
ncbi:putative (-)-germacrene D synthase [Helianthus debilis subsp. tardiflorus]